MNDKVMFLTGDHIGSADVETDTEASVCSNDGLSSEAEEMREYLKTLNDESLCKMAIRYFATMPDSQAADLLYVMAQRLGR